MTSGSIVAHLRLQTRRRICFVVPLTDHFDVIALRTLSVLSLLCSALFELVDRVVEAEVDRGDGGVCLMVGFSGPN